MFVDSFVISIAVFCYFFFDCGYPEVAIYCFVGNIPECIYKGSFFFFYLCLFVPGYLHIFFYIIFFQNKR